MSEAIRFYKDGEAAISESKSISERAESLARAGAGGADSDARSLARDAQDSVAAVSEAELSTADSAHEKRHDVTSGDDHFATPWRFLFTNGAGSIAELPLGPAGTVLTSSGDANTPSFEEAGRQLYEGSGIPSAIIGTLNSYYLDTDTSWLWRKKLVSNPAIFDTPFSSNYVLQSNDFRRIYAGFHKSYYSPNGVMRSDLTKSAGKWYMEFKLYKEGGGGKSNAFSVGITQSAHTPTSTLGSDAISYGYQATNGNKIHEGIETPYGDTYARDLDPAFQILGIALDLDNGELYFSLDGVWQNSGNPATRTNPAFTGISGTYHVAVYSTNYPTGFMYSEADELQFPVPSGFNEGFYGTGSPVWEVVSKQGRTIFRGNGPPEQVGTQISRSNGYAGANGSPATYVVPLNGVVIDGDLYTTNYGSDYSLTNNVGVQLTTPTTVGVIQMYGKVLAGNTDPTTFNGGGLADVYTSTNNVTWDLLEENITPVQFHGSAGSTEWGVRYTLTNVATTASYIKLFIKTSMRWGGSNAFGCEMEVFPILETIGEADDFYEDKLTKDLYQKGGGSWAIYDKLGSSVAESLARLSSNDVSEALSFGVRNESLVTDLAVSVADFSEGARQVYDGTGTPAAGLAGVNNYYLDKANGNWWRKIVVATGDTFDPAQLNGGAALANSDTYNRANCKLYTTSGLALARGQNSKTTGKVYIEFRASAGGGAFNSQVGIVNSSWDVTTSTGIGDDNNAFGFRGIQGQPSYKYHGGSGELWGTNFNVAQTFMMAVDFDAGRMWVGVNGTWMELGDPATGANPMYDDAAIASGDWWFAFGSTGGASSGAMSIHTSPDELIYPIPVGFEEGWYTTGSLSWEIQSDAPSEARSIALLGTGDAADAGSVAVRAESLAQNIESDFTAVGTWHRGSGNPESPGTEVAPSAGYYAAVDSDPTLNDGGNPLTSAPALYDNNKYGGTAYGSSIEGRSWCLQFGTTQTIRSMILSGYTNDLLAPYAYLTGGTFKVYTSSNGTNWTYQFDVTAELYHTVRMQPGVKFTFPNAVSTTYIKLHKGTGSSELRLYADPSHSNTMTVCELEAFQELTIVGKDGDWYENTTTKAVFLKDDGSWASQALFSVDAPSIASEARSMGVRGTSVATRGLSVARRAESQGLLDNSMIDDIGISNALVSEAASETRSIALTAESQGLLDNSMIDDLVGSLSFLSIGESEISSEISSEIVLVSSATSVAESLARSYGHVNSIYTSVAKDLADSNASWIAAQP